MAGAIRARAYSPAHITAFFRIYAHGSTGAGLNLEDGVVSEVSAVRAAGRSRVEVSINGRKSAAKTSRAVVRWFLAGAGAGGAAAGGREKGKWKISVRHRTKLPIGYGLGVSGAAALSLALALNHALRTELSPQRCMRIAQRAEIECGTGLGDVVAEMESGVMAGKKPYPSRSVEKIKSSKKFAVMGFFAPISTKKIIRSAIWKKKINRSGGWCMREINLEKTIPAMVRAARAFAVETCLATPRIRGVMEEIPDACQAMLGETVFVITNKPLAVKNKLKKFGCRVLASRIAERGAHLL